MTPELWLQARPPGPLTRITSKTSSSSVVSVNKELSEPGRDHHVCYMSPARCKRGETGRGGELPGAAEWPCRGKNVGYVRGMCAATPVGEPDNSSPRPGREL